MKYQGQEKNETRYKGLPYKDRHTQGHRGTAREAKMATSFPAGYSKEGLPKLHSAWKARSAEGPGMPSTTRRFWKVDMQRFPKPTVCHLLGMKIEVLLKAAERRLCSKLKCQTTKNMKGLSWEAMPTAWGFEEPFTTSPLLTACGAEQREGGHRGHRLHLLCFSHPKYLPKINSSHTSMGGTGRQVLTSFTSG